MIVRFGTPQREREAQAIATRLRLHDGPLDLAWHHCTTTSEFVGDFFADQGRSSNLDFNESRHAIGYLVNELVENAVKFRAPGSIRIEAFLAGNRFDVTVENCIEETTADSFKRFLADLTAHDPAELLIQRIEANAADPQSSGSGLGLLTLMSDYGAHLGWEFSPFEEGHKVSLKTYASLPLT
jgi:hypothetical protein